MKPEDLFWCPSCGEVFHLPNKTLHRGVCREHDALMMPLWWAIRKVEGPADA